MSDRPPARRGKKRRTKASAVREAERHSGDAIAPPFVLVVDDVEDNRELYATFFSYGRYRVEQAGDGEQALSMIARDPPDIVLMDLSMPNLDGWEGTRLIKSNPRTRHILVLVVTGFAMRNGLERAPPPVRTTSIRSHAFRRTSWRASKASSHLRGSALKDDVSDGRRSCPDRRSDW